MALLMRPPVRVSWCKIRAHACPTPDLIQRSTIALIYSGGSISPPSAGGNTSVCFEPVEAPIDVTIQERGTRWGLQREPRNKGMVVGDVGRDWARQRVLRRGTDAREHQIQERGLSLEEGSEWRSCTPDSRLAEVFEMVLLSTQRAPVTTRGLSWTGLKCAANLQRSVKFSRTQAPWPDNLDAMASLSQYGHDTTPDVLTGTHRT
ncbi:hypothetical protein EDB85DRAFT_1891904 [Lactarius pseudohatsudake]|nr:hypothetical protein EDB85DRAFT_1891904 [Lactarius pseudohatsudake]